MPQLQCLASLDRADWLHVEGTVGALDCDPTAGEQVSAAAATSPEQQAARHRRFGEVMIIAPKDMADMRAVRIAFGDEPGRESDRDASPRSAAFPCSESA